MKKFILDTNILIKWYYDDDSEKEDQENLWEFKGIEEKKEKKNRAVTLFRDKLNRLNYLGLEFIIPSLACYEFVNAMSKKFRKVKRATTKEKTIKVVNNFRKLLEYKFLKVIEIEPLYINACDISCNFEHSILDCCFLSLAIQEEGIYVTTDKKFGNGLKQSEK